MAKKQFDRNLILEKTFELASEIGIAKLSMRKVASELGCSVMPLYDQFDSKEGLISALSDYAQTISLEDMKYVTYTERHISILRYGLMFPDMYFDLVKVNRSIDFEQVHIDNLRKLMRNDKRIRLLSNQKIDHINTIIEVFVMGIIYLETIDNNLTIIRQKQLEKVLKEYIEVIIDGYSN